MKKMLMALAAVAVAFGAWAETETVGGYTWTYRINGDTAEIYGTYNSSSYSYTPAISPSPTGAVTIPSSLGGKPVTSIGNYAFHGCSALASVTIPASVTSIGGSAFRDCYGLTSVTIPDSVTSIGGGAFCYSGLTSVRIPYGVTNIVGRTFYGCSRLSDVTICDRVKIIERDAFFACSNLTHVVIPNSVERIGSRAFGECINMESLTLPFVGCRRGIVHVEDRDYLELRMFNGDSWNVIYDTSGYAYHDAYAKVPDNYNSIVHILGRQGRYDWDWKVPASLISVTITDDTMVDLYSLDWDCTNLANLEIRNEPMWLKGRSTSLTSDGLYILLRQ